MDANAAGNGKLLEVVDLKKYFPIQRGFFKVTVGHIKAVDGVSFSIRQGETLGLVGESGCGKTTLGRCIVRLYDATAGSILFYENGEAVTVMDLKGRELRAFRRNMQIVFQDPYASLNPRMTVQDIVGEPLVIHGLASGKELQDRVEEMLAFVGLQREHMRRYPHSFSGGQRQRIGIARALVLRPKLVVADEPVSALDVSIQAQTLNLLKRMQADLQLTYLFVSHDLGVVRYVSDRIAVMYVGKLVELSGKDNVLATPRHPYTESLLSAVPRVDLHYRTERIILPGEAPDPSNLPPGCVFHTRCRYAKDECTQVEPKLREISTGHFVACHRADQFELRGVSHRVQR
ncbi:MAG TPA: dipeptide ABC transporter ATP-binding protein [Spirochaetia bacterium]|nr:dipeptide ABC transporter ATP-binding protein [Spirochaetia bacterium]